MVEGRPRVLVADDEEDLRSMVSEFLSESGYKVLVAANGLESLVHVKRARPSVVLLDLNMPRLGGLGALKRIRAFDPNVAVIVITGEKDPELQREALALGAVALLHKPFELPDLMQVVHRFAPPSGEPVGSAAAPEGSGAAGSVLVVDDEEEVRSLLVEFLSEQGYSTFTAGDGLEGIRQASAHDPDIVLLDYDMPELDGMNTLAAIKAVAPETKIIMVSGLSSIERARETLSRGAVDFVVKPIDLAYLGRTVDTAMTLKRLGT